MGNSISRFVAWTGIAFVAVYAGFLGTANAASSDCYLNQYCNVQGLKVTIWYWCNPAYCTGTPSGTCMSTGQDANGNDLGCRCPNGFQPPCLGTSNPADPGLTGLVCAGPCPPGEDCMVTDWEVVDPITGTSKRHCKCQGL